MRPKGEDGMTGDWGLPERIESVEQLDEVLTRPSQELVAFMAGLQGDILVLGAGGKVGPTIVHTARRAVEAAGVLKEIIAVDVAPMPALECHGVSPLQCDLLDLSSVDRLPDCPNVIYMAGRKFGSEGAEHLTWAINVTVPYHVARRYVRSRIVAFSTGCVYPVMHVDTGGATEETDTGPIGEYAQSCLGRERMFDYFSHTQGEKVLHLRLNYAVELRYGVLFDVAAKVWAGEPVDVTTGYANVIWQGDVANQVIRCLDLAESPPKILNLTGPETISIRDVAQKFGTLMNKEVRIAGEENGMGYLSNAAQAHALLGQPSVNPDLVIEWIAYWIQAGGESLGKPTHFEAQDGKY